MAISPRQMICPQSNWGNKCPYAMTAKYITVHNTANDASANNEISYMNRNTNQVSFHFAVDDVEVVQGIPLNRNAWHAGDGANGKGNRETIGIEICYSKSGGDRFNKSEALAAKFIAQLLKERNWGIDKVKKHQDWSGKYCPHRTLDMGWGRFIAMVEKELDALNPKVVWKNNLGVGEIEGETDLVDVATGKVIKKVSGKFEYVQTTEDGKWARTAYSRDNNINNGVATSSFKKPTPPPQPKYIWVDVPKTTMYIKTNANLTNLDTGAVVKVLEAGTFEYVQKTSDDKYARTDYSKGKNLNYGVLLSDLEPIPAPAPEPEPKPDEPDDPTPDQIIPILQKIIMFIQGIIDSLLKKNK